MLRIAELHDIAARFAFNADIDAIKAHGDGHIHDTFLVRTVPPGKRFILQKINQHVFPDIEGIMANMSLVVEHMREKLALDRIAKYPISERWRLLEIIPTCKGERFYSHTDGSSWRMFPFIEGAKDMSDRITSTDEAAGIGEAIAFFHFLASDLDPGDFLEVLRDFHHLGKRIIQLEKTVSADMHRRLASVDTELEFIRARKSAMMTLQQQRENGTLPVRVTHNDTKFNNMMLNDNDQAISVIDLDTIMPGLIAYDVGDAVRTLINEAVEDEADVDKIRLNMDYFSSFINAYAGIAREFIEPAEIESLIEGILMLPFIQATRFLTDYLQGDTYFKIAHPAHNLQRCRAQIQLVRELENHQSLLKHTIFAAFAKENLL